MKLKILLIVMTLPILASAGQLRPDSDLITFAQKAQKEINKKKWIGKKKIELSPSKNSGTSAYLMFEFDGEMGAILPENSATVVLGEIFSYQLSRALEVEDIYSKKTLMLLEKEGLDELEDNISTLVNHNSKWKRDNANRVLGLVDQARKDGDGVYVAFAPWNLPKPIDYNELKRKRSINGKIVEEINFSHPLVQQLFDSSVSQDKAKTRVEYEIRKRVGSKAKIDIEQLTKDLSNMLVIDVLTNQWDRYSGGNLQLQVTKKNEVRVGVYDNGGTFEDSPKRRNSNLSALRKFEKKTVKNVLELADFILGNKKDFRGVKSVVELKKMFQLHVRHKTLRKYYYDKTVTDTNEKYWRQFVKSLGILRNHILTVCKKDCYL